jgi:signal peptidase I
MFRRNSVFRLLLEPLGVAIALALIVRAFVHIYTIPSASMIPTLQAGDHIVVTPYWRDPPKRGDVVVFRSPRNDQLLVKRIIGTPGDFVQSRAGEVIIGNHVVSEPYLARRAASGEFTAQIVPADCYFVMGDNRASSLDSRSWGVLPRFLIVGKARLVLWSSADTSSQPTASAATGMRRTNGEHSHNLRLFHPIE